MTLILLDNTKYVTMDVVYQRLTQRIKNKQIDFLDVVEWSTDCMINDIGWSKDMFEYRDVPLTITDLQAVIPGNCFRIECVKRNNAIVDYIDNGAYLNFTKNYLNVLIDYWAIPTDAETSYPLIPRGYEEACFWACLKALYLEEYLDGRLDANRWNTMDMEYSRACGRALSNTSHLTKNDRVRIMRAKHTISYNYENVKRR